MNSRATIERPFVSTRDESEARQRGETTVVAGPGAVRHPAILRRLVAALVAASFLDNFVLFDLPVLRNVASVIGFALLGVYVVVRFPRIRLYGASLFFVAFLAVTAALELNRTFVLTGRLFDLPALAFYMQYVQVVVLYLIVVDIARDPKAIPAVAATFFGGVVLMSLLSHAGLTAAGMSSSDDRVGVVGINLNRQAFMYALAVVGAQSWILGVWPRFRLREIILAAGALSCVVAMLMTGSRGGAATLVVGLVTSLALSFRQRRISAYLLLAPVMLIAAVFLAPRAAVLQERVQLMIEEGDAGMRDILFLEGVSMFQDEPYTGWGATFPRDLGERMLLEDDRAVTTHNVYLEMLVAFGIVGFVPWILGVLRTIVAAWRCRSVLWGTLLLAALITTLVYGWVDSLGTFKHFWVLLAIISGLYLITYNSERQDTAGDEARAS
jgi:hypothetical protein